MPVHSTSVPNYMILRVDGYEFRNNILSLEHNQSGTIDCFIFLPDLENGRSRSLECSLFPECLGKKAFYLISDANSAHLFRCGPGRVHKVSPGDLAPRRAVLWTETQSSVHPQKKAHDYYLLPLI